MSNFMKVHLVEAELFHAERQRDRHDAANSRLSPFCERAYELVSLYPLAFRLLQLIRLHSYRGRRPACYKMTIDGQR
jgi:hypothetical protein